MDEEKLLLAIADATEEAVRKGDRHEFGKILRMGADGTPTTVVDDLAEQAILRVLADHGNPWNVLSEEAGVIDHGRTKTLVVDPIDGTRNAARGLPAFCVSLALCQDRMGDATHAVVRDLVTSATYIARRGGGATLNGEKLPLPVPGLDEALVSVELDESRRAVPTALLRRPFFVRVLGSACLEICYVAQGALDAYVHTPPKIRVIDIAGAALILREAGGELYDAAGRTRTPLDMPLELTKRAGVAAVRNVESLRLFGPWEAESA
ncbi:MAG: inositol monophosphatase family protein [Thermoplasmatota archaeon]